MVKVDMGFEKPDGGKNPKSRAGTDLVQAAGAALYRRTPERVEVALVHRQRYDDWSLPKGKVDPGES